MAGTDKVPISTFLTALHCLGSDADADEVECMFASLIHRGLVKGYVSHGHRTVVVAKVNPFPKQGGSASA